MNNPKVTVIPAKPRLPSRQEVAPNVVIYARVSTRSAAQLRSLAAQVSKLTRFAASRGRWTLVDIYMDVESASGSALRTEYNRMIEDAEAGKFSIVLTKSVQRFGRNTEETLRTMRTLLAAGVIIYFQIEGYASNDKQADMFTAWRTGLAAADNASRREDRKWGVQKRVEDGTSEMYRRPCYGYKKTDDGALVIDRKQAETVREMFRSYLAGASIWGIKKELERKHVPSPTGKETWPSRTIDLMLSNEKYTGNIILFKTVMANYPYSVRRINDGGAYRQQYCMTNGVEAIIDEETFKAVQDEKKRRSSYEEGPEGKQRKKEKYSSKRKDDRLHLQANGKTLGGRNEPGN